MLQRANHCVPARVHVALHGAYHIAVCLRVSPVETEKKRAAQYAKCGAVNETHNEAKLDVGKEEAV